MVHLCGKSFSEDRRRQKSEKMKLPYLCGCAKIDAAAVCSLQFSLLFAVCKMSLFCTEII